MCPGTYRGFHYKLFLNHSCQFHESQVFLQSCSVSKKTFDLTRGCFDPTKYNNIGIFKQIVGTKHPSGNY